MTSIAESMRKVAEAEVRKMHFSELGVVTSVFPHADDSDKDNYECSVKLKDRDLELRKVPVATPQVGLVNVPQVGDLVLLSYINGDINSPVIVGRLYNDEDRPPSSQAEEMVYKLPYSTNADLRRLHIELPEGTVTITFKDEEVKLHVGDTDITINKDAVSLESKKPITIKTEDDLSIKAKNITLEGETKTTIKGGTVDINP
jgi:uncharacterized protein involved in type VI secretion and phage assembly